MADRDGPGAGPTIDQLRANVARIRRRIEAAGGSSEVTIVGVTKTFPVSYVEAALSAGLVDLGENYGQELVDKADQVAGRSLEPRWHFIGGLQRNKIKLLGDRVWLWQTVDRAKLIDEIAKRVPGARILVQVNTTGEDQKSGCRPDEAPTLVGRGREAGLDVLGLMTVGPTGTVERGLDPRPSFDRLRELGERCEVKELSMGMSADYESAVAAGATMVRIGSAIFGPRTTAR